LCKKSTLQFERRVLKTVNRSVHEEELDTNNIS